MKSGEVGLMAELAERYGPQLRAAYELALESARRDLACDIPEARAAAREFLEREAAREAIRAARQADKYTLTEVVLVFRRVEEPGAGHGPTDTAGHTQ